MLEKRLLDLKKVKIGGVTFVIQKLSPSLFMDKEYMFPISDIKVESGSDGDVDLDAHKDKISDIISKGTVRVKYWFERKDIGDVLEDIMKRSDVYLALFTAIVNHTMGVKKNSKIMKSTSNLRYLFII